MISYKKSQSLLKKNIIKIKNENILSINAINKVCAKTVYSNVDFPSANNSAFDGYAIKSLETNKATKSNNIKLKILKTISAGIKPNTPLKKFSCVEIMTGGLVPKQFDTILPVEAAKIEKIKNTKYLVISKKVKKNQHLRLKGSDFKKKEIIISKGQLINSSHIFALKTLGIKKIIVKKKPNILLFSTGNEITEKNNIPPWMVRNSNSYYLGTLKENFSFNYIYGGILRDNDEKTYYSLIKKKLKSNIDIIISIGAVSAGKYDFVPKVIKKFKTKCYFKGVLIRPGKPILFSKIQNKSYFGLPGNPMSAAACFRFFVYPYLCNILGMKGEKPLSALLQNDYTKKKNLTRFANSQILFDQKGKLKVKILKDQESFRIKSFLHSNSWTILDQGKSKFKKGEFIDCYLQNIPNIHLNR